MLQKSLFYILHRKLILFKNQIFVVIIAKLILQALLFTLLPS